MGRSRLFPWKGFGCRLEVRIDWDWNGLLKKWGVFEVETVFFAFVTVDVAILAYAFYRVRGPLLSPPRNRSHSQRYEEYDQYNRDHDQDRHDHVSSAS